MKQTPLHAAHADHATSTPRRALGLLLLLIVIGVVLRVWLIGISPLDPRFSNADDGDYYRRALRFAVTGNYIDDAWLIRPPLHVFFYALCLKIALVADQLQRGVLLIQLAQTAIAAATIALGYDVARRIFASVRAGLFFAAFLALWFPFVEQPSVLFSELLYTFLFLLHVWLLLHFDATSRLWELALAGLALGAAALTRSPALYSLTFVVAWLIVRDRWGTRSSHQSSPAGWRVVGGQCLLVCACCLAVVGPWTARNAYVYQRFIPIDTLGPINLWLDLDDVSLRGQHIEELRRLPQADRQAYASARARAILAADPLRPFRFVWPTFRHIWKAQYVEDFFIKQSFYTRPLRDSALLGLFGDLLWLIFTLGGIVGLAGPAREGLHNRLFVLAWLSYALLTVIVFHVEPRYLLPIWTLIGLYGAGVLAKTPTMFTDLRAHPIHGALAFALVSAILALFLSYRDYPAIIATGIAREQAIISGERAYARDDMPNAERAFRAALAIQPTFVDTKIDLALTLMAQARDDEAIALMETGGARRAEFVQGILAARAGDRATARDILARIEATAGENIQHWASVWLRPPATHQLTLGDGQDFGSIEGFSGAENGPNGSFRWLESAGRITLTLPDALQPNATLALRISGGQPNTTPLDIRINDGPPIRFLIVSGDWRTYQIPLPATLIGQRHITIDLRAPPFIPARNDPTSQDLRTLSLMIGEIRIKERMHV